MAYEYSYDAWGRLRNPQTHEAYVPDTEPALFLGRGYTGHEHLQWYGLINMNARLYDPALGRFLSPDPYVQMPDFTQNFNRYSYCLNNPLVYVDEDGEVWWLVPVIAAAVFATGNTMAHAIRGDIHNFWDGAKYFAQGAVTGFALGAAWQFAPLIPGIGSFVQTGMTYYAGINTAFFAAGSINDLNRGLATGNWSWNAGKIFLGNFYLDENKPFLSGVWEGFSRHTWQFLQTGAGNIYSQARNYGQVVDRVDYLGGATFATNENSKHHNGVTIGNYVNMNIWDKITGGFDDYVTQVDPMYMHEYGHYIDSQKFGPGYVAWLLSVVSASKAKQIPGETWNVTTHDQFWTEMGANRNAKKYFGKYYGVDWNTPYRLGTYETYYPTIWRW